MLQAMDGAILLVAGGWLFLLAFGWIKLSRDAERAFYLRQKYGAVLSVLSVILIGIGLARLTLFVLAGAE